MTAVKKPHMTPRQHALFWAGAFALFIGFVWLFSGMLLPFILGMAIAYFLDPLVRKLAEWGLPRWAASGLILGIFLIVVVGILALILPMAIEQARDLITHMPDYIDAAEDKIAPYLGWAEEKLGEKEMESVTKAVQENVGSALSAGSGILAGIAIGGQAIIGFITTLAITPIIAFFMMIEWPRVKKWFYDLMPRDEEKNIRNLLSKIDRKLAGFIRGQLSVAFVLGLIYAIALTIAGLNFGFLIGLMAGALSIIPLIGSTVGLVVSVCVAWFQEGSGTYVVIIAVIFFVGQFLEGNIISPRLLGKNVDLHPLWIFFALLAGGSLLGIVGMLLAVPVAAVVGVLAGFAIEKYKNSPYYKSTSVAK